MRKEKQLCGWWWVQFAVYWVEGALDHPEDRSAGSQIAAAEWRRVVCVGDDNVMITLQMIIEVKCLCYTKQNMYKLKVEKSHRQPLTGTLIFKGIKRKVSLTLSLRRNRHKWRKKSSTEQSQIWQRIVSWRREWSMESNHARKESTISLVINDLKQF